MMELVDRQYPGWRGRLAASVCLHAMALAMLLLVTPKLPPAPAASGMVFSVVFGQPPASPPSVLGQARFDPVALASLPVVRAAMLSFRAPAAQAARMAPLPGPAVRALHASGPALVSAPAATFAAAVPAEAVAALESRIDQAVNAAKFYPPAARQMRRQGRAAISFAYQNGGVAEVALAQSSQVAMLDNAALAAVRRARYPQPPAALNGQTLRLRVWVDFSLVSTD